MLRRLLVPVLPILLLACGGPELPAVPPSTKCPPPGAEVPLQQMINPSFGADFIGCHVKTKAAFLNATTGGIDPDPNMVQFMVQPGSGGLTGVAVVRMKKQDAAIIFQLKPGDPVVLTGGTMPMVGGVTFHFLADAMERGTP